MDRRITKTKEAIQNAFFQLIEENQTTKITITKIAKTANIDRKTFYTHYNSPTDIIVEFCEQKTKEFFAHLEKENFFDQPLNSQNVFSGVISVYRRYLQKDNPYNLEEVSQILNDVTFYGLTPILEKK